MILEQKTEPQKIGFIGFGEVGRTFAQEMKSKGAGFAIKESASSGVFDQGVEAFNDGDPGLF